MVDARASLADAAQDQRLGGGLELDWALLGVFADEQFPLQTVQLSPGDSLLMYSDGFESAFTDPAGLIDERYRLEFCAWRGKTPGALYRHGRGTRQAGRLAAPAGPFHDAL